MDVLNVFVVDDERVFLEILVKRMRKREVNASGFESGEDVLEALDEDVADVVVLDVKMPGMDGIETLKEIKRRHPLIEVIMLTGHASLEVAVEGMGLGAFDYLMKPIDIDELLYKIQDAYKKKLIQEEKIKQMKEAGETEHK